MSIFGNLNKTEEPTLEAYAGYVEPSLEGSLEITRESAEQMYALNASMYVTDVMLETAILEGEEVEEVFESVVKDSLEKAKKIFTNFFQKLRAWFMAVKQKLTIMFTSAEKFVDKYEKELHEKAKQVKDFEYEGYNYNVDAGQDAAEALHKKIEAHLVDVLKFDLSKVTQASQKAHLQQGMDEATKKEDHEALLKALGAESNNDIVKDLSLKFKGSDDKVTVKVDVTGFIKLIKGKKDLIGGINKAEKATNVQYKEVMRAIEGARKDIKKAEKSDEQGRALALANRQLNTAHKALALWSTISGVEVKMIRSAASQAESVLKKLLTYKSKDDVKEDEKKPVGENTTTESLLESAARFI